MIKPQDWYELAQVSLPMFGNDLERVIWSVDVRQLVAILHGEMGRPGENLVTRQRRKRESELMIEQLQKVKV